MITLQDVVLCTWTLKRPVLVTSKDPDKTIARIQKISENISVTSKPSDGISVYNLMLLNMEKQLNLYTEIRKGRYSLILVTEDFHVQRKLQTQLLLNYFDKLDTTVEAMKIDDIDKIRKQVKELPMTGEIKTYIYDLIVELRYSRFVKGGIPTYLIFDVKDFIKFWAFTRHQKFVTPILVKECFRIVLPIRIQLIQPKEEPSLMYGSDLSLASQLIQSMNVHDIIEIAISKVTPPI